MKQTEVIEQLDVSFPLSNTRKMIAQAGESMLRTSKRNLGSVIGNPINNFLKSHEEMEAEFRLTIISAKRVLTQASHVAYAFGMSILKTDEYLNIHSIYDKLSGDMEENY